MEFFHITLLKSQKISQLISEGGLKNGLSRCLPIEGTLSLCTLKIESPPPAVKIGTTLKIPKISVINYVMEKEVKKVG